MKKLLSIIILLHAVAAHALPTVTDFRWAPPSPPQTRLTVTVNNTGATNPTPVPPISPSASSIRYGISLCSKSSGCLSPNPSVPYQAGDTWDDLGRKWNDQFGATFTTTVTYNATSNQFPLFEYCMTVWGATGSSFSLINYGQRQPGSCLTGTASAAQCTINATAEINYGPIDINAINGLYRQVPVEISCDRPVTVAFSIVTPTIDLGHGVQSTFTVGGQTNPLPVTVQSSGSVNVGSTLSSTNPTPGPINGNAVLIVTPQ